MKTYYNLRNHLINKKGIENKKINTKIFKYSNVVTVLVT